MRAPDQLPPISLNLKAVATTLHLGVRALAKATGMGRTPIHQLLNTGAWPVRAKREPIEQALLQACREAGATPAQLDTLFMPSVVFTTPVSIDPVSAAPTTPTPEENPDMLLPKQSLTRDAQRAFEMFMNPFDGEVSSAQEMFLNAEFRYCREACWQAANHGRFVAVIAQSGAGKTTLLGDLQERILAEHKQVVVVKPSVLGMEDNDRTGKTLKASGIMDAVIYTLDALETPRQTMEAKTRQLQRMLEDSTKAGNVHLLVIEEAHGLPINTLKHLKRLHEMRMGRKPLLGILLLGQQELRDKLSANRHDVREVAQRCEIVDLLPLDSDLKAYITLRLARANKLLADVMDDAAVDAIRTRLTVNPQTRQGERSQPISFVFPLAVNNFVTAALNTAAALGVPRVTRDVVMGV